MGFRISRAVGSETLELLEQRPVGSAGGERSVDLQTVLQGRHPRLRAQAFVQERSQGVDAVSMHGEPRRHGVSAPGHDQSCVEGGLHSTPEIDARLRPAGSPPDARSGVEADDDHRLAQPLAHAAGDDADHAGMPALSRHDDHGVVGARLVIGGD